MALLALIVALHGAALIQSTDPDIDDRYAARDAAAEAERAVQLEEITQQTIEQINQSKPIFEYDILRNDVSWLADAAAHMSKSNEERGADMVGLFLDRRLSCVVAIKAKRLVENYIDSFEPEDRIELYHSVSILERHNCTMGPHFRPD